MTRQWVCVVTLFAVGVVYGALPSINDCHPAQAKPFDSTNPGSFFGFNQEIAGKASPARVGNLRQQGPLPTGHFATGHIKSQKEIWPMIQTPYEALLTKEGVVYDAYTMDRWSKADRTDLMEQQSAWEAGKPWHKLNEMGSNLKQMTSGPDGNPLGVFTGKSGIRVSIDGIGEPEMTSFGELYANFLYHGNGGSMEVPIVRGSALLTHMVQSANPVLKPYCLSSVNGRTEKFSCPKEATAEDGGVGFLEGSCHGSTLTLFLHSSKEVKDMTKIQWAVETKSNWGRTYMRNCDSSKCRLENGGKTVRITIPNASGVMNYAINSIGHYLLPPDWTNKPGETTCTAKRDADQSEASTRSKRAGLSMAATCSPSGQLTIVLDLGNYDLPGIGDFQYAVEPASKWVSGFVPPMRTCDSSHCQHVGSTVTMKTTIPASDYKLALNILRIATLPPGNWIKQPFQGRCDGSTLTFGESPPQQQHPQTTRPTTPPPKTPEPALTSKPPKTDSPSHHTSSPGTGNSLAPDTKFVLELDEPGSDLPQQTRKFVVYFSSPVTLKVDRSKEELRFEPKNGGKFNGLVQIAYAGSGPRGDKSQTSYFDSTAGYYSYKPKVEYCASQSLKKAYLSYTWNAKDQHGRMHSGDNLLMITMPHHARLLQKLHCSNLYDTPFTFKGHRGGEWQMEMDLLHTEIAPDVAGVNKVKANAGHNQEMRTAIDRDSKNTNLDAICAHSDSYNVGKSIGMVTRLASLSRAFGTSHFGQLDTSIRNCLEKWLRVKDTLDAMWKFRYDNVWGGLFLRATNGNLEFGVDYGFPFYNDHHFHLGYFLYALAYFVKHYPQWGQAHKTRIYSLARDVGNPSAHDRHFPVARQKDMYTGFSWASGVVPGTRQEESASEGINCYHGLAALGEAFDDDNMRQTGQVLLAMEVLSVREYWQEWANSIKETCQSAIDPRQSQYYAMADKTGDLSRDLSSGWKAFCYAAMAPLDSAHAQEAANYVKGKKPQELVGGTGAASTLLFIYGST